MLVKLPMELKDMVAGKLSAEDLYALSQVSREYKSSAEEWRHEWTRRLLVGEQFAERAVLWVMKGAWKGRSLDGAGFPLALWEIVITVVVRFCGERHVDRGAGGGCG